MTIMGNNVLLIRLACNRRRIRRLLLHSNPAGRNSADVNPAEVGAIKSGTCGEISSAETFRRLIAVRFGAFGTHEDSMN